MTVQVSELGDQEVRRRRVFYIPGYGPIPPRRYRELYRKESRAQAEISGYEIDLSAKKGRRFGWSVRSLIRRVRRPRARSTCWSGRTLSKTVWTPGFCAPI